MGKLYAYAEHVALTTVRYWATNTFTCRRLQTNVTYSVPRN